MKKDTDLNTFSLGIFLPADEMKDLLQEKGSAPMRLF